MQPNSNLLKVTCSRCGLACDDLSITVQDGQIQSVDHGCGLAQSWLCTPRPSDPAAMVDGQSASVAEAVEQAVKLLSSSKLPLFAGFESCTIEAARAAIALAERCGGILDPGPDHATEAMQQTGMQTCTLGDVRQRADVIVFVQCDPAATHPRLFERCIEPPGRWVPAGRTLISIGSSLSNMHFAIPRHPAAMLDTLWRLRLVLAGKREDAELQPLVDCLRIARFTAFFFDESLDRSKCSALFQLVAQLHDFTRAAAIELHAGTSPIADVLCWQTGYALPVSFASGAPRSHGNDFSAEAVLARGGCDLVLLAGREPALSQIARSRFDALPTIRLSHDTSELAKPCRVAIRVAEPGYDAAGVMRRLDGVLLPTAGAIKGSSPTIDNVMQEVLSKFN